jgi:hypothetical protein
MSTTHNPEIVPAHQARTRDQLASAMHSGDRPDWLMFWGHRPEPDGRIGISCLSQWYPVAFTVEQITYPSAEHFMMCAKARVFQDADAEERILQATTADEAKRLGRRVRGFDETEWSRHRESAVFLGNTAKFHQNPQLGDFLAGTGRRVLVEASPYDRIWGIGLRGSDPRATDPQAWPGLNLLGFTLMRVRAHLGS